MSNHSKKERERATIERSLSDAAAAAASLLQGFGTLSKVGFIAATSLIDSKNNLEIKAENRGADGLDSKEKDTRALEIIRQTSKVNPLLWKPQLEHIALLGLREACLALRDKDSAKVTTNFDRFSQAIIHARTVGPISSRTNSKILDLAHEFRDCASFLHMSLNSLGAQKDKLLSVFLAAGVNPEFKIADSDLSPLAIAAKQQDATSMQCLIKAGAIKTLDLHQVMGKNSANLSDNQRFMNAWDAKNLLARLSPETSKPRASTLKLN